MLSKNEIKYIRSLQVKKHRDTEGKFIAEGHKWVEELLKSNSEWVERVYATPQWEQPADKQIASNMVQPIESFEMEKITALSNPTTVLAVVRIPNNKPAIADTNKWNLLLDGIQDPGNLGSIIRIADWFGMQAIWCSEDCADAYNPKVVQATMGSLCRVQVNYTHLVSIIETTDLPAYATAMEGKNIMSMMPSAGLLIIGSEGKGVRPELIDKATQKITIPRIGEAESLNVAVATGIIVSRLVWG